MAEGVGFEPTEGAGPSAVFKTAAIDHSATLPLVCIPGKYSTPESSLTSGVLDKTHEPPAASPGHGDREGGRRLLGAGRCDRFASGQQ